MIKADFMPAEYAEADEILNFYRSFIGTEGCTWSEEYPGPEHIRMDIEKNNLFRIKDERGIVATISIDSDAQVDALSNWMIKGAGEAARLAVRKDMQNSGIAREMLRLLMDEMKQRGYQGLHFLVSPGNPAALASYAKLQFVCCGEAELYEHKWLCYEKEI